MAELGLQAYRFSISWSRVLPEGEGRVNEQASPSTTGSSTRCSSTGSSPGSRSTTGTSARALRARRLGSPESPRWFAEFAHVVAERLGDRVETWLTLNEPQVMAGAGYLTGEHAPGRKRTADVRARGGLAAARARCGRRRRPGGGGTELPGSRSP